MVSKGKIENKEVWALARHVKQNAEKYPIVLAIDHATSYSNTGLSTIARTSLKRHMLSCCVEQRPIENKNANDLLWLLHIGIEQGIDIRSQLGDLADRIEEEEIRKNKIRAKTLSNSIVAYASIIFFMPLFVGISANIIGTQAGEHAVSPFRFITIMLVYLALITYLANEFSNPERSFKRQILLSAAYLSVSAFVLIAAYIGIGYVL